MDTNIVKKTEIRFKVYDQNQLVTLPVLLSDLVKDNHQVQLINKIVDGLSEEVLSQGYSAMGCPSYSPKMLLKVWIYGYCQGIYTSRKLAKKLREDLCFMWLSGKSTPCFKTLASFRSVRMQESLAPVLESVLYYLLEKGYIDHADLYVDGSKWEANNNKYKIVWAKNTARYKEAVLERIKGFLGEVQALQAAEDAQYKHKDLAELGDSLPISVVLNSEELSSCVRSVEQLVEQAQDKAKRGALNRIAKDLKKEEEKLVKYEVQEELLAGRNSYAKTDPDATGLRMKDEQLKPGYNVEITTSNQYILHSSIHQNASDSPTLIPHLEGLATKLENLDKAYPISKQRSITADAGYGSEENYVHLDQKNLEAYVKYPLWYKEIKKELEKQTYRAENWVYDTEEDYYLCPEGKKLSFVKEASRESQNGYTQNYRLYECASCLDCPVFKACRGEQAQAHTNRTVRRNELLKSYQEQARTLLGSAKGKQKRSQRSVDVETPFGDIKYNMQHRRFLLRGLEKVTVEFNLLALCHNIRKIECQETGKWKEYYAQRAVKSAAKNKKAA